jgi:hypothetical protein
MTEEELNLTTYCIENMAAYLNVPSNDICALFIDSKILDDYIIPCENILKTFGREYIVRDLLIYLHEKGFSEIDPENITLSLTKEDAIRANTNAKTAANEIKITSNGDSSKYREALYKYYRS